MNKPIRIMAVFCLLLFVALMINATWLQFVHAEALNENNLNRRVHEETFSRERGPIVVGRDPVAESVKSNDEFDFQRRYPEPYKYAHVTGFYSYAYGASGLEDQQNSFLDGSDDSLFVDRLIDTLSNASPKGASVQLTLDRGAQTAAYDGLEALGDVQGAVVALEPDTGKILAMVSAPSYDPNTMASHDPDVYKKAWKRLNADDSQPMLNRAIQTTLPPGSTFKLVTAAAAIESGDYDKDSLVPGGATFDLPDSSDTIGNESGGDCGGREISLTTALEVSCNVSFLTLADHLGDEALRTQAEKFGFNQKYLEDLPAQAESRYPEDPDAPQTAMTGIGQFDVAATPLQMAMVAGGIANGGVVKRPYLVDEVISPDLQVVAQGDEEDLSRAVSPNTAEQLTDMMVGVVNNGTGTSAQIPGIQVAGKTGTAQSTPERPPYAWFVGFAPADNPEVAVAVLVESSNTERSEIAGGRLCAPIARSVMQAVINDE